MEMMPAGTLRDRILEAAWIEFGDKGFAGARMDEIAKISGASKQVLYHHFLSKEGLFLAVLDKAYVTIRGPDRYLREALLELGPDEALTKLIESLFGTSIDNIRFQRIMHDENRFEAVHARGLDHVRKLYGVLLDLIEAILEDGVRQGKFRSGIVPAELFASLAGLFMFRLTNRYTLSVVLDLPLDSDEGARLSRQAAVQMVLDGLRP